MKIVPGSAAEYLLDGLLVIAILLMLLFNLSIPYTKKQKSEALTEICYFNLATLQRCERLYRRDFGKASPWISEYFNEQYIQFEPICPKEGIYSWEPYHPKNPRYQKHMVCSYHGLLPEDYVLRDSVIKEKDLSKKDLNAEWSLLPDESQPLMPDTKV